MKKYYTIPALTIKCGFKKDSTVLYPLAKKIPDAEKILVKTIDLRKPFQQAISEQEAEKIIQQYKKNKEIKTNKTVKQAEPLSQKLEDKLTHVIEDAIRRILKEEEARKKTSATLFDEVKS